PQDPPPATSPRPEEQALAAGWTWWGRVALMGAWVGVAVVHLVSAPERRSLVWNLGYLLIEALACASLGYRAWRSDRKERLAWQLLWASTLLDVINLSLWIPPSLGHPLAWASDLPKLLSLGTGLLVLAAVLSFPRGSSRGGGGRRRVLDGLLFAASVLFLLWVVGVHGALRTANPDLSLRVLVAYLNAALMGGGLVYMTSSRPHQFRGPLGWLGASALAWLVVLSGWAMAGLPPVPQTQWWWPLVGGIPLFQGLAAWSPTPEEVPAAEETRGMFTRLIPYLPVVGALAVMAVLILRAPLYLVRGASGIFLVMVALLLLRQVQAVEDLESARRTLEDRVHDRTRVLEQAQHTLIRTERMNALAMMGAGLAHDLNNLLGAVKSSADLAVMNLEEGVAPGPSELNRIAMAADRAALLTRRLMEFARREEEALQPVDLGRELRSMEVTLRLLIPRAVNLVIDVPLEDALIVKSSTLRLEQMMVNLVANARDAMPTGGHLGIQVTRGGAGRAHALIEVIDSGTGMTPEVLARIFDPFYTTKEPGKGTGLGLSSLKAMVEESGGSLGVESEPGLGTRFRILLPLVSPR
ncbi:MAG: hypothetical protein HXX12_07240, partial [Geothrix sp.]